MHPFPGYSLPRIRSAIVKRPQQACCGLQTVKKPLPSIKIVGAIIDRPPKNGVFRISRREITIFSPDGDEFCWSKIRGRPMVAPTDHFFDTLKAAANMLRPQISYSPTALFVSMVWISFHAEGFSMVPGCSPMRRTFLPEVCAGFQRGTTSPLLGSPFFTKLHR